MTLTARDIAILNILQRDSDTSLSELGEQVHLSPSACSRRVSHLREQGYIQRNVALIDRLKVGLPTTVFIEIVAHDHTQEWMDKFRQAIHDMPEIIEVHSLTGTVDYLVKVILAAVEDYDRVYKTLVKRVHMAHISAYISMETLKSSDTLPLELLGSDPERT